MGSEKLELELQTVLGGWRSMGLIVLVNQVVLGKEVSLKVIAISDQHMMVVEIRNLLRVLCSWV
jgi:hypothetical protein